MLKSHFKFVDKGFLEEIVYRTMVTFANYFWVFARKCLFYFFGFVLRYILRLESDDNTQKNDLNCRADHTQPEDQIDLSSKRENREFFFGFRFQKMETETSTEDFKGFIEEPENMSFSIQDFFSGSNEISNGNDQMINGVSGNENLEVFSSENPRPIDEKNPEFSEKISNPEEVRIGETGISCDGYMDLNPKLQFPNHLGENFPGRVTEPIESLGISEEPIYEDDDGFDVVLKHKNLIEQMKTDMKKARSKGLFTILEESESPKMVEDLKPLLIDEKIEHKDIVGEIQKVYKGYAEKMRKLDVLNCQTLHAISFLQSKDPIQKTSAQKTSVSAIKSLIFPNLRPSNLRRIHADPTLRSISGLQKDLETVYVGQACLSWEIISWQYGKAKELLENDSGGNYRYNQVAGEFQQFQVLVQRFVENGAFQGPRVQNYAKKRYELGSLLQAPAIRDDCLKDKRSLRVEGDQNVVSITMLTEIIDESMHLFWEFLHADKDEASGIFKMIHQSIHVDLQDPSDSKLLMDIKTSLHKEEKRHKGILRRGNCIVKKFQKQPEGRMDHALLLTQVELKLVSRVLNMPRLTTDQLVWCRNKLNKISFLNRKVHVEPSFLFFPC